MCRKQARNTAGSKYALAAGSLIGEDHWGRPPVHPSSERVTSFDSHCVQLPFVLNSHSVQFAWCAGKQARCAAGAKYALASRSLIGEGRQYIRALNEALLLLIEGCTKKQLRPSNLAATEQEVAAAAAAAANLVVDEAAESREPKEAVAGTGRTQGAEMLFR